MKYFTVTAALWQRYGYALGLMAGWTISGCLLAIVQDWLGKDRFVAFATRTWVNTPWWVWLFPILFQLIVYLAIRRPQESIFAVMWVLVFVVDVIIWLLINLIPNRRLLPEQRRSWSELRAQSRARLRW